MPPPSSPQISRDSSIVRASVYDAFFELGGLQQDSQLADWVFNKPSSDVSPPSFTPKAAVHFADNVIGSKFTESFEDPNSDDEAAVHAIATQVPYRRPTRTPTRAVRLMQRVRSKSKPRRRADSLTGHQPIVSTSVSSADEDVPMRRSIFERRRAPHSAVSDTLVSSSLPTSPKKKPFFFMRSRSTADVHDRNDGQDVLVYSDSERTSADTVTTPTHTSSQPSSSHGRPLTPGEHTKFPIVTPATPSALDDDWERLSRTSSPTALQTSSKRNPFLSGDLGPPPASADEKSKVGHGGSPRRISFFSSKGHDRLPVPGSPPATIPLRRTRSKPEAFSRFHIPSIFPRAASMPVEPASPSALERARTKD
jgi:hypothetical protein